MTQREGQNASGAESASPSDRPPASLVAARMLAPVTLFAAEKDIIRLTAAGADLPSFERIAQQYVWQFCKSVPLLDITQTLRWNVPFVYPDAGTGTLVLLYKLAVIIPLIGAFLDYWRQQTE